MMAATAGYIREGQPYRGDGDAPARHRTGDIFKVVHVSEGGPEKRRVWIQHCCRQDDLLVHRDIVAKIFEHVVFA